MTNVESDGGPLEVVAPQDLCELVDDRARDENLRLHTHLGGDSMLRALQRFPEADIVIGNIELIREMAEQGDMLPLGGDHERDDSMMETIYGAAAIALKHALWFRNRVVGIPMRWAAHLCLARRSSAGRAENPSDLRRRIETADTILAHVPGDHYLHPMWLLAGALGVPSPGRLSERDLDQLSDLVDSVSRARLIVAPDVTLELIDRFRPDVVLGLPEAHLRRNGTARRSKLPIREEGNFRTRLMSEYDLLGPTRFPLSIDIVAVLASGRHASEARRLARVLPADIRRRATPGLSGSSWTYSWNDIECAIVPPGYRSSTFADLFQRAEPRSWPRDDVSRLNADAWRELWRRASRCAEKVGAMRGPAENSAPGDADREAALLA